MEDVTPWLPVHKESMSRIELFNTLMNASLYAGVFQGELYKPNAIFTERLATDALTTSRNRFELFFGGGAAHPRKAR
jgi:hypothetical protein